MYGVITFRDDFTISCLADRVNELREEITKGNDVIIDISEVIKIDLAAIQMLIATKKECLKNGHELILKKSKEITGMLRTMGIEL